MEWIEVEIMFNSFILYMIRFYRVIQLICTVNFTSKDVYDAIPTIVTTFVAIIAKISIFIFLLGLVHYTSKPIFGLDFSWTTSLLFSSVLSLVIGTVVGLTQSRIKRLFAFSTISHVGFILLGLSIHTVESTQAFMFYLIQYSISNLNAFILIITIGYSLYSYVYDGNIISSIENSETIKKGTISGIEEENTSKKETITYIERQEKSKKETMNSLEKPETTKKELTNEQNENNERTDLKNNLHDVDNSPLIWVESRKPPLRVIQPNYGKILNLMIPSNNWKTICGWTNYSGTVIIHKMIEREMDYRVSKSVPGLINPIGHIAGTVKEQRVDGWDKSKTLPYLSCTLAGFERNNQIKILSNQIKILKRFFSVNPKQNLLHPIFVTGEGNHNTLHPYWVTGFLDGESSFVVSITKREENKTGWQVQAFLKLILHKKDRAILEMIRAYFNGVGNINNNGKDSIEYRVASLKDLTQVVVPILDKYPLISQKLADYLLFKKVLELINAREHLNREGLHRIVAHRASMNNCLSEDLKFFRCYSNKKTLSCR